MSDDAKTEVPSPAPRSSRRRRFWAWSGLMLVIALVGVVYTLPALLSTPRGNRLILERLNRVFAPGRLSASEIRLSWTEPTRIKDLSLADSAGKPVVTSPSAVLDRSLYRILTRPKDSGTLLLEGSRMDLARLPNGELNLQEALGHVFDNPDPERDLTIKVVGQLRVDEPALGAPLEADSLDFSIRFLPYPEELTWSLEIGKSKTDPAARIKAKGTADRWRTEKGSSDQMNMNADILVSSWPLQGKARELAAMGRLETEFNASRNAGRWTTSGKAEVVDLKLDPSDYSPSSLNLAWRSGVDGSGPSLGGSLKTEKLGTLEGPFSVRFDGRYLSEIDRVELSSFILETPMAKLDASGTLDQPLGVKTLDLKGNLAPDYEALTKLLAARVEPGARISGVPSPWLVKGSLSDASTLIAEGGISLTEADFHGMKLGKTLIRSSYKDGLVRVDPIDTTLNEGRLVIRPLIDLKAPGGVVVRLGSDTSLTNAVINDEVSRRVLSFVAPVLNQATQVNGYVSASITSAEFPISKSVGRKADVQGDVVFRDVTFAAGPLTRELLAMVIRDPAKLDASVLTLNEPIHLMLSDGKVTQKGLSLPIGPIAKIELNGWVDFDRKLGLVATIPLNPELFPKLPLLNGVARATRFEVPIGGTLDDPKVDGTAFKANMAKMGRDIIAETGTQGLIQLFSTLAKPRDPNAPPPPPKPTAEERKAKRLKQKAERLAKKKQNSND